MAKLIDLTGQRFGRLTVLKRDPEDYIYPERFDNPQKRHTAAKWICRCDCGNTVSILGANLRHGNTQSCGCIWKNNLQGRERMNTMKVKLDEGAHIPTRAYPSDAGLDLYSRDEEFWLWPGHNHTFDTGVHIELPPGMCGLIFSRSGLLTNYNIVAAGNGVIDETYRGSIGVKVYNMGSEGYHFVKGERVAQLVIVEAKKPELEVVDELSETDRGEHGFGSTGK